MDRLYDLDDITLIPRVVSTIKSRDEIKPSVELFPGVTLTVPIIASPMMDVCDGAVAKIMRELGGFGFIHRFQSIGDQVAQFYASEKLGGCAIGLFNNVEEDEGFQRFKALYAAGCRHFCLDVANGATESAIQLIEGRSDDCHFVVGNVASKEGYDALSIRLVQAIRCGIAGGGGCTTKNATGIYHPMASLLDEIDEYRSEWVKGFITSKWRYPTPKVIADGGISSPDRFCKALALGAEFVMMGSALAVAKESPAQKINAFEYNTRDSQFRYTYANTGPDTAIFRGSASFEVQKEYREPRYIEGKEVLLPYSGKSLEEIVRSYMDGLRSSMSYFNARTLEEYRTNVTYGVLK